MGERSDPFPTPPVHIFWKSIFPAKFYIIKKFGPYQSKRGKDEKRGNKTKSRIGGLLLLEVHLDSDVCLDWYCEWCYIMSWAGWGRCPYILASLHTTSDGGPAGAEWAHCRRRVHSLVVWTDGRCSAQLALLTCTLCNMKHYCARSVWWWAVRECIDWWWERTTVLTLLSGHLLWGCPHIIFWSWYPDVLYGICAHTLGSSYLSDQLLWGAPLHPDSWFWFHDNLQDICVCNNQPVIISFKCYFHPSFRTPGPPLP